VTALRLEERPVTSGRVAVVLALGATQTIAWASSYYMPAILGGPIADALHLPAGVFFGLFSGVLLLSAVLGPSVERLIDRHGGRDLLATSSLVIAAGLLILAAAQDITGLYDAAFATSIWLYGRDARRSITGITLIAGFASTIGWPLSALLLHELGGRSACLMWAGLNMLLAGPLNCLTMPRHRVPETLQEAKKETPTAVPAAMPIMAFFFCRYLVRTGSDGGAFAGPVAASGRVLDRCHSRRVSGRPGSSGCPHRRVWVTALVPSDIIGAARFRTASRWRCVPRYVRCSRHHRFRAVARRRQRHDHDREGYAAFGRVRAARLWVAQRFAFGTGTDAASGGAIPVWLVA
jgi:hypothetical protein